jgi:hypothetical protein
MIEEELNWMKNKRIRLIAVVLTLAMAFSICAMPASAAATDENVWAAGVMQTNLDGSCYEWGAEAFWRDIAIAAWLASNQTGALTEERLKEALENGKTNLKNDGYAIYEGALPSNAYLGYSKTKDSTIYWYTKTDYANFVGATLWSVDWGTGTLTYTVDGVQKKVQAIASTNDTLSGSNSGTLSNDSQSSDKSSSGGSSNDSTGMVLLLAGGAVVVGAIIYLYTHPAVVQNIKNFFTGSSAAEQPAQTVEESAEAAAENAADVNAAAAETAEVEQAA